MCRVCSLLFKKKNIFKAFRKVQKPQVQPVLAEEDNKVINFELSSSKIVSPEKCKKTSQKRIHNNDKNKK